MLFPQWTENADVEFFFYIQDEEEVPLESGKDDKDEAPKEEAAKEKQDESEDGEKTEEKGQEQTEEAGSKTDTKVRSDTSLEKLFQQTQTNVIQKVNIIFHY